MLTSEISSIATASYFPSENSHGYSHNHNHNFDYRSNRNNNNINADFGQHFNSSISMVKRESNLASDISNANTSAVAVGSKRLKTEDDDGPNPPSKKQSTGTTRKGGKNKEVMIKGAWSPEEDKEMLKAVSKYGTDWKSISKCVRGRTAKQCRDRYKLKLDPSINHGPWTPEEDQTLLNLHAQLGRQWTKIAKLMRGRTENSVKSRYASLERSRTREWTEEEDATLRAHKEQDVSFEDIAKFHLPHRSEHAVKKRWERLFMRDLARKIRSEMPSLKNSNPTNGTQQPYKNKSPFPINPRLLPTATVSAEQKQQPAQSHPPHVDFVVPTAGNTPPPGTSQGQNYGGYHAGNIGSDPYAQGVSSAAGPPASTSAIDIKPLAGQTMMPQPQMQAPPKKSSRQSKFKRHSTSVTVMMQLIGEPLNK